MQELYDEYYSNFCPILDSCCYKENDFDCENCLVYQEFYQEFAEYYKFN